MLYALSVCQPWAWALIHGPKRIENRNWRVRYRGPLLIHAPQTTTWLGTEGDSLPECPPRGSLVFGALIGLLDLIDCKPYAEVADQPFTFGPECWVTDNPRQFEPVPWPGKTRLFPVPLEAVSQQLLAAGHKLPEPLPAARGGARRY